MLLLVTKLAHKPIDPHIDADHDMRTPHIGLLECEFNFEGVLGSNEAAYCQILRFWLEPTRYTGHLFASHLSHELAIIDNGNLAFALDAITNL